MSYKLGILDQSPIFPGASAFDALQQTINLARHAEEWGYTRFWVSEHHHAEQLAGVLAGSIDILFISPNKIDSGRVRRCYASAL